MSATHRTKEVRAASLDFYRTPRWCIEAIRQHIPGRLADGLQVQPQIFDPCAGDGAILDAFCETEGGSEADHPLGGIEIQPELAAKVRYSEHSRGGTFPTVVTVRDALAEEPWGATGHVVMNPPFNLAEAFIRRAIAEVAPHKGSVFALLRLGFLESDERQALHLEHPSDLYILPKRPSFCMAVSCKEKVKCGWRANLPVTSERPKACPTCGAAVSISTADASAYAWFHWGPLATGKWTILDVDVSTKVAPFPWPSGSLDVHAHRGLQVRIPSTYPDGSPIGRRTNGDDLAFRALKELGLVERLEERRDAGVPLRNLVRVFGAQIEARVVAMMQAGVRIVDEAEKPKRRAKATPARAELGDDTLEAQLDDALAQAAAAASAAAPPAPPAEPAPEPPPAPAKAKRGRKSKQASLFEGS